MSDICPHCRQAMPKDRKTIDLAQVDALKAKGMSAVQISVRMGFTDGAIRMALRRRKAKCPDRPMIGGYSVTKNV